MHKLIPSNAAQRGEQELLRGEIWAYYADLKAYRAAPAPEETEALTAQFKTLFAQRTGWATLDRLLRRIRQHRCTCSGCWRDSRDPFPAANAPALATFGRRGYPPQAKPGLSSSSPSTHQRNAVRAAAPGHFEHLQHQPTERIDR